MLVTYKIGSTVRMYVLIGRLYMTSCYSNRVRIVLWDLSFLDVTDPIVPGRFQIRANILHKTVWK